MFPISKKMSQLLARVFIWKDQAPSQILDEGAARAAAVAAETLRAVYDRIGFVPAGR